MDKSDLQQLQRFQEDSKWFHNNINSLREKNFTGKFVAIKNNQPIISDEKIENVVESLEQKKENPSFIFIEFVHPEGVTILF